MNLLKRLKLNVRFATRVCEIIKNENEPLKYYKRASVTQKHKVGHPGPIERKYTFGFIQQSGTEWSNSWN